MARERWGGAYAAVDDEDGLDMRNVWRIGVWGGCAAGALALAVLAGGTDAGLRRLKTGAGGQQSEPAAVAAQVNPQLAARAVETEKETRRLAEALQVLTGERDRLAARVETLERNIEEITGSIQRMPSREAAAPTAPAAASSSGAAATQPNAAAAPASAPAAGPAPSPSAGAPNGVPTAGFAGSVQMPPLSMQSASLSWPIGAMPPIQMVPTKPPGAVAPADDGAADPLVRTEFGVDLGSAVNIEGLRALWASTKAAHGPLFEALRPLMAVRDGPRPGAIELRLIAGPFVNAVAAARVCAVLTAGGRVCQPSVFDGQRLALR
jgi:hypothetical protein